MAKKSKHTVGPQGKKKKKKKAAKKR